MSAQERLTGAVRVLSFPLPLRSTTETITMKALNYTIKPLEDKLYYITARIKRNGKDYKKRERVKGKREAERRAREMVNELEDKYQIKRDTSADNLTTVKEVIDFYLEHTPKNTQSIMPHIKVVLEHLGAIHLDSLQEAYDLFIQQMKRSYTYRGTLYSDATINRFTTRLTVALNFCRRKKRIPQNFSLETTKFKEYANKRIFSVEEEIRLTTSIERYAPHLSQIVKFAMQVPSRKSELVEMRTEWIDLERLCVVIPREYLKGKKTDCVKPIPPNMVEYFSTLPEDTKYVFYRYVESADEYKSLGDFKRSWHRCLEKSEISGATFHCTRGTAITRLARQNVPERVIMEISNWSTNMLGTYYGNSGQDASETVIKALQERIKVSP